ncbi:oxidoreductase [Xylogone sp. PMI_703]|nr:oxidoreductase [Xylogone sp. PMI_703]
MSVSEGYDFIVVGSGPAGCTLAARIAETAQRPRVLLLEAGGNNSSDNDLRVDGQRWVTFMQPHLNWGYKTVPQEYCNNRVIDYSRGLGLGGSSAINFGVYAVGAKGDYDRWAKDVGDERFNWDHMQKRFKSIEAFHPEVKDEHFKYLNAKASDHGSTGKLHIGFAQEWEKDVPQMLDVFKEAGFPTSQDHNSGNPIGMGPLISSAYKGLRSTAADLLEGHGDNLIIKTNSPVQRLILEGNKVIGVQTNGQKCELTIYLDFAGKEVILSAGSLDTPKILMLSGIGPRAELEKHNIPVIQDIPAIGQGLRDHFAVPIIFNRRAGINERGAFYGSKEKMDEAFQQWKKDGTGPWTSFACQLGIGWFKSPEVEQSAEFKALPTEEQKYLTEETVPHYELLTHFPAHMYNPEMPTNLDYSCILAFLMNGQSRGQVSLQSSDPKDPLLMDPKLLSHPYDRSTAIHILRHALNFARHPAYAKDTTAELLVPSSDSDNDILEHLKTHLFSTWHMTGTVKMGKAEDVTAAVDNHFRVKGIERLRVADMSVVPVLTNNHTQTTAYVTGATAADVLIDGYGLNDKLQL